ncbi:MAG: hypothetical protein JW929_12745 [Anaerolineales bacterium]|nr:hypothetical protein [Anaerolineales bacterium]
MIRRIFVLLALSPILLSAAPTGLPMRFHAGAPEAENLQQAGPDRPEIPARPGWLKSADAAPESDPVPTLTATAPTATFAPVPSPQEKSRVLPVARILLFFSTTCGHCRLVETEVVSPLQERFADQLEILRIDTRLETGYGLYQSALAYFGLPRAGVPFLVIGRQYLLGSVEIKELLEPLIEQALAQGGADWPDIPGIREYLAERQGEAPAAAGEWGWFWNNLRRDPAGNAVSVAVLAGMLASLAAAAVRIRSLLAGFPPAGRGVLTPALCVVGLFVAGYLAYVEVFRVEAVCGPVGDCNTVQTSSYARLFGILPIGVLGVFGYGAILASWIVSQTASGRLADLAAAAGFAMSLFGNLFSIYLTFLEPFVIGASCLWCLTSAVLMTALFWASLRPGLAAIHALAPDMG